MDKYIKFGVVMEYLRNRSDEARKCGHEETYFDLLTIINGLKDIETIPANSALDHIHNVVKDDAYRRGYEQAKEDCIKAVRDCYESILDVETDGHTIADSVEDIITERVRE